MLPLVHILIFFIKKRTLVQGLPRYNNYWRESTCNIPLGERDIRGILPVL
jgi:hypothetical protein